MANAPKGVQQQPSVPHPKVAKPAASKQNIFKVFIGGGFDDWFTHIVEAYANAYRLRNPKYDVSYYSWTKQSEVGQYLLSLPKDAHITMIGHSYGGDAAFSAVSMGRAVDVLISIDPVGRIRPSWTSIRSGARVWLNVRAQPSANNRTSDDTIAAIGGKYPLPPRPGQPDAPNYSLIADVTHGRFTAMMNATSKEGVSGASLLGGGRVG